MEEEIKYVPGVESINTKDFMPFLKESQMASVISIASRIQFEKAKRDDFILQNTVEELEPQTLSALNEYIPNYAIGPLHFSKNLPTNTINMSLWSESNCTDWLDSKPPGSVLYVSFGSFIHSTKHVIEELAHGLAISEVNFLWVIRQGILGDGGTDVLFPGFKDEIRDRGLIVGWCDQVRVLSNPAVGGFLTHSGWNSTLESMWIGVPMICYPIAYDQPSNRKLVVDDWKIGTNLYEGGSLDRKQVVDRIKSFMNGGVSDRLRQNTGSVRKIMQDAVEDDGSSERNFERFIKDLDAKIHNFKTMN